MLCLFMLLISYLGNVVFCNAFKLEVFSLHGQINNNLTN